MTYSTYHNLAEKKKTIYINHTAIISIIYTTEYLTKFRIWNMVCDPSFLGEYNKSYKYTP